MLIIRLKIKITKINQRENTANILTLKFEKIGQFAVILNLKILIMAFDRHAEETICDFSHFLTNCPSLFISRSKLLHFLCINNIMSLEPTIILNSFSRTIIIIILKFFENAGFLI